MTELEDELNADTPRTAEEIARRALVLSAVMTVAYGASPRKVRKWLKKEGLIDEATPVEMDFLKGRSDDDAKIAVTWKVECLAVLLWCIRKIGRFSALSEQCDTELLKTAIVFPPHRTAEFISPAQMRDLEEIEDEREVVYQAHWRVRDAEINDKPMPEDVDPGVVYERHYAFNWVTGYMGQSWDEITTDT